MTQALATLNLINWFCVSGGWGKIPWPGAGRSYLAYSSRGMRVRTGNCGSEQWTHRNRNEGSHLQQQVGSRVNWKEGESFNSRSPPPVTHFLQQDHTCSNKGLPPNSDIPYGPRPFQFKPSHSSPCPLQAYRYKIMQSSFSPTSKVPIVYNSFTLV